jgi:hypothetical protein
MERISSLRLSSPAGGFGRPVVLPHFRVAGLVEDDLGELRVRGVVEKLLPALEAGRQLAQCGARLRLHLVAFGELCSRL